MSNRAFYILSKAIFFSKEVDVLKFRLACSWRFLVETFFGNTFFETRALICTSNNRVLDVFVSAQTCSVDPELTALANCVFPQVRKGFAEVSLVIGCIILVSVRGRDSSRGLRVIEELRECRWREVHTPGREYAVGACVILMVLVSVVPDVDNDIDVGDDGGVGNGDGAGDGGSVGDCSGVSNDGGVIDGFKDGGMVNDGCVGEDGNAMQRGGTFAGKLVFFSGMLVASLGICWQAGFFSGMLVASLGTGGDTLRFLLGFCSAPCVSSPIGEFSLALAMGCMHPFARFQVA